jgi:hypothetical protein
MGEGFIGIKAAAGMDIDGIMSQSGFNVIGAGGTHTAQQFHTFDALIYSQHTGDFTLGGDLIDDIGLRNTKLRLGSFDIVDHHSNGAQGNVFLFHRKTGERIDASGNIHGRFRFGFRLRFRFGLGKRCRLCGHRGGFCRGRGRCLFCTATGQEHTSH